MNQNPGPVPGQFDPTPPYFDSSHKLIEESTLQLQNTNTNPSQVNFSIHQRRIEELGNSGYIPFLALLIYGEVLEVVREG